MPLICFQFYKNSNQCEKKRPLMQDALFYHKNYGSSKERKAKCVRSTSYHLLLYFKADPNKQYLKFCKILWDSKNYKTVMCRSCASHVQVMCKSCASYM